MGKRIADTFSTVSASGEEYPTPRRPRLTDRNPIISAVQSGQRVSTLKLVAAPVELENQTVQIKIAYNHSHGVPSDADVFQFVRSEFPAMDIVDGQYRPGVITLFIRRAEDGITRSVDDGDTLSTEEIEGTGKIAAEGDKPTPKPPVRVPWRALERAEEERTQAEEAQPPAEAGASATPEDELGKGRYVTQPSKAPFREYIPSKDEETPSKSRPSQDDPSFADTYEEESDIPPMPGNLIRDVRNDEKGLLAYVHYRSPNGAVEVAAVRDDGEPPKFEKKWFIVVRRGVDPESPLGQNPEVQQRPKFKLHEEPEPFQFYSLAHGLKSARVLGAIKVGLALEPELEEIKRGRARSVAVSKSYQPTRKPDEPASVSELWHKVSPPGQTGGLVEEANAILKDVGGDEWRARQLIDKRVSQGKYTDIKGKNLKETVSKILVRKKINAPKRPDDELTARAKWFLYDKASGDVAMAKSLIDDAVSDGRLNKTHGDRLKERIDKELRKTQFGREVSMGDLEEPLRPEPESKYIQDYSEPGGFGHKNPKKSELIIRMGQAAAPPAPGGMPEVPAGDGSKDLLGLLPGDEEQPGQGGPEQPGEEGLPGAEGAEGGGLDLSLTDALESAQQAIDTIRENVEGGDAVIEGQELEHVPEAPAASGPPIAPAQAAAQPITAQKKPEDGDDWRKSIPEWVRKRVQTRIPKEEAPVVAPPPPPPTQPEPELAPVGEGSFVGTVFPVSSHWSDEEVEAAADIRKIIRAVFNRFGVNSWEDYETKVPAEARQALRDGLSKASQNLNGRLPSPARLQEVVAKLVHQLDTIENKPVVLERSVSNAEGTTPFFEPEKEQSNKYNPSRVKLMPKDMSLAAASNEDLINSGFVSPAGSQQNYTQEDELKFQYLDQLANTNVSNTQRTKRVKDRYDVARDIVQGEDKAIDHIEPKGLYYLITTPYSKPGQTVPIYTQDKLKRPVLQEVREIKPHGRHIIKPDPKTKRLLPDWHKVNQRYIVDFSAEPPKLRSKDDPNKVVFTAPTLEQFESALARRFPNDAMVEEIRGIRAQRPGQKGDYLEPAYHWERLRKHELDLVKDQMVAAILFWRKSVSKRQGAKKRDQGGWTPEELQKKMQAEQEEKQPYTPLPKTPRGPDPREQQFEQGVPVSQKLEEIDKLKAELMAYQALPPEQMDPTVLLDLKNRIDKLKGSTPLSPEMALAPGEAHEQFLSKIPENKELQQERLAPSRENIAPPSAIAPPVAPDVKPGRPPVERTLHRQQGYQVVDVPREEAIDPASQSAWCDHCKKRQTVALDPAGRDMCAVCKGGDVLKIKPGYAFRRIPQAQREKLNEELARVKGRLKEQEMMHPVERDKEKLKMLKDQLADLERQQADMGMKYYKTIPNNPAAADRYKWSDVPSKPAPPMHGDIKRRTPETIGPKPPPGFKPKKGAHSDEDSPISKDGVDDAAKEYWEEYMDGYGRQMVEDPDLRVTTRSAFVIKIAQELGIQASEDQIVAIVETLENRPTGDGAFLIWAAEGGEPSMDQMVDLALEKGQTDSSVMKAIDRLIGTWMLRAQIAQPLTPEQQRRLLLQAISHDSSLRSRFRRLFRKTLGQPATTEGIDAGMPDAVGAAIGVTAAKFKMPSIKGKGKDSVKDVLSLDDIGDDRDIAPAGHICFAVDGVTNTGVYTRMKITWAPEDVNVSDASLHHAIKNFIKGLESRKVSGMDFGYIGFITVEDCDPKAGAATVQFRAKRPVGPMQVVES